MTDTKIDTSREAVERVAAWCDEIHQQEYAALLRALRAALDERERQYRSAVETLVDIAAMGKKAGSESAKHRLRELGVEWATGELGPDYGSMT